MRGEKEEGVAIEHVRQGSQKALGEQKGTERGREVAKGESTKANSENSVMKLCGDHLFVL